VEEFVPNPKVPELPTHLQKLRSWQQVEGEVQGNDETLQKFFKDIDKGPRLAHVVKVEKRDLSPEEGEDHFAVRRTSDSVFEAAK
jgi:acylphosphatase